MEIGRKKNQRKIIPAINLFLFYLFMISCTNQKNKEVYILGVKENLSSWDIVSKSQVNGVTLETFRKMNNDTIFTLLLNNIKTDTIDTIVYKFTKSFMQNKFKFVLIGNIDTLTYYREDTLSGERYFFVGKYYYDYKSLNMSPSQSKFYIEHEDSLIKIRGNSLTDLPIDLIIDESFTDSLIEIE